MIKIELIENSAEGFKTVTLTPRNVDEKSSFDIEAIAEAILSNRPKRWGFKPDGSFIIDIKNHSTEDTEDSE